MDRATLLQIFQSRLERSDYSKLQKQGRTFYQEARRQASNTQARYIFVSSLFFFFCRAEEVVCVVPCIRMYVCMYVCLYVCMCVCHVCIPLFHVVAVRFSISVCSLYMLISVYTGSVVVVLVAVVSRFVNCRCISHVFTYFITFIHSFVPVFVPCILEFSLPTYYS